MKLISILVPCYNEVENVEPLSDAVIETIDTFLPEYDYEIVFIDNHSTDGTREKIESLCKKNEKIRAIFNSRNFGQFNSPYYGLCQMNGDCVIPFCADFQDPLEMIPRLVREWEKGYQVVAAIKTESDENKIMRILRTLYYKIIKKMSDVEQIEHFTGFGAYDKKFIEILRELDDPTPNLRGVVAELAANRKDVPYRQQKRKMGHTHNNFYTLYDGAMLSFTTYTKIGLRMATMLGFFVAALTMLLAAGYLVVKLVWWDIFQAGIAPILISLFFIGSVQLIFMGLLGEYILSMNLRLLKRPLVIEEKRLNMK